MLSALLVMGVLTGCDVLFGRQPTVVTEPTFAAPQPNPATQVPPTEIPPDPTPSPTETPPPTAPAEVLPPVPVQVPQGPELLKPPDEAVGSLMDLVWEWDEELDDAQWFELYIWPDDPDVEPKVYGWYKEPPVRVTAASLFPGRYRWKVIVVEGRDEDRGEEVTLPSEEWRFTIVRPSTLGAITTPSPMMPTRTPTRAPMPINTPRPLQPSPTPDRTITATPTQVTATPTSMPPTLVPPTLAPPTLAPPTATPTSGVYPGATNTPAQPLPTLPPGGYPGPTNTPAQPMPTLPPGGYPEG
jgi:hypothetical protein